AEEILSEYRVALGYDRVTKRNKFTLEDIDKVIADLRKSATLVAPTETVQVIAADPDDNKFLECATAGGGDYIVSGDRYLLNLRQCRDSQILSPAVFVLVLGEGQNSPSINEPET